jgi:oligoribonuclease
MRGGELKPVKILRQIPSMTRMPNDADNLAWIDLEMTGLRPDVDHIIEIATLVTDKHLRVLAEGPVLAIHQPDTVLDLMDEWNRRQHGASGLIARVKASSVTAAAAERSTLEFLSAYVDAGLSPMCGNGICQDRRFLARQMPELERFFHYRNLDVSTLKELARRWAPALTGGFQKSSTHLALDDVRESVRELEYYREHLFTDVCRRPDAG